MKTEELSEQFVNFFAAQRFAFPQINDFHVYLDALLKRKDRYLIMMAVKKGVQFDSESEGLLWELGIRVEFPMQKQFVYVAVIDDDDIYEYIGGKNANMAAYCGGGGGTVDTLEISTISKKTESEYEAKIVLDWKDYSVNGTGLNLVLYDKLRGQVIDSLCYDGQKIIRSKKDGYGQNK